MKKFARILCQSFAVMFSLIAIIGLTETRAIACASCGCTLSSDWENMQSPGSAITYASGLSLDLRYDFLDQNQLRHGTDSISATDASKIKNDGQPQEVEKDTKNNYVTLGVDYNINRLWGINVQVPFIDRMHSTLGTNSNGITPGPGGMQYDSHTDNLGDIRITGRYQGILRNCTYGVLGVLGGIKLPTGSFTETGTSTDSTMPGPVPIDRGLQPGSGTTDLLLGAYYSNDIAENWDYFGQVLYQRALNYRQEYRPGDSVGFNLGMRYAGISYFSPLVQFNLKYANRDSGAEADRYSTGGTLLYVSPGVSVPVVSRHLSVYGFVQVPLYQDVNGVQLSPRFTTTVGVRYAF
ncbi:MAG: TonB-dependent receptor [Nitrospirota bacterium]